jgi:glycolate oxidase FAD binding subunit
VSKEIIERWQSIVQREPHIHVAGAKTKLALHRCDRPRHTIDATELAGITSYDPQEFVVSVWTGTPVAELQSQLAQQGQYLPFDPMLVQQGATLGGTVCANAAGPGRFRFGGIRDFLIGVHLIDGNGNYLKTGGRVVKNAAGFDYPKLMVGSCGRLGILCELTFKVFPKPEVFGTVLVECRSLHPLLEAQQKLSVSQLDVEAVDLRTVPKAGFELAIRVGGMSQSLSSRMQRVRDLVQHAIGTREELVIRDLQDHDDQNFWRELNGFLAFRSGERLTKVPITPSEIPAIEARFQTQSFPRHYSVAGNVLWIGCDTEQLETTLASKALAYWDSSAKSHTSPVIPSRFGQLVKQSLDSENKFS